MFVAPSPGSHSTAGIPVVFKAAENGKDQIWSVVVMEILLCKETKM